MRFYTKSYMLRNQKIFDGLNTDDLIRGLKGINFAESIGFGERASYPLHTVRYLRSTY